MLFCFTTSGIAHVYCNTTIPLYWLEIVIQQPLLHQAHADAELWNTLLHQIMYNSIIARATSVALLPKEEDDNFSVVAEFELDVLWFTCFPKNFEAIASRPPYNTMRRRRRDALQLPQPYSPGVRPYEFVDHLVEQGVTKEELQRYGDAAKFVLRACLEDVDVATSGSHHICIGHEVGPQMSDMFMLADSRREFNLDDPVLWKHFKVPFHVEIAAGRALLHPEAALEAKNRTQEQKEMFDAVKTRPKKGSYQWFVDKEKHRRLLTDSIIQELFSEMRLAWKTVVAGMREAAEHKVHQQWDEAKAANGRFDYEDAATAYDQFMMRYYVNRWPAPEDERFVVGRGEDAPECDNSPDFRPFDKRPNMFVGPYEKLYS